MSQIGYLVDVGVLLPKNSEEYNSYAVAYDKQHAYYDENQYYVKEKMIAIEEANRYVQAGVAGTYGIVSETELPDEFDWNVCDSHGNYLYTDEDVGGEDYSTESVVYSAVNTDGKGHYETGFVGHPERLAKGKGKLAELCYDEEPYFARYKGRLTDVLEDLCKFANGMMCGEQLGLQEELGRILELPIHRGYHEEEDGRHYEDAYLYKGKIYTAEDLARSVTHIPPVKFDILKMRGRNEVPGTLSVGLKELFYYDKNVEGRGGSFVEFACDKEEEQDIDR